MRYLVTGGMGFLGSHLCESLVWAGHSVLCIDSGIIGNRRNIAHLEGRDRFQWEYHDICHPMDWGEVDGIYHLASPTAPVETYRHAEMTLTVNSKATLLMIEMAKKYNARLLFASSIKVKDRFYFGSTYIQGKILGEQFCQGNGAKVARMGNIYGPRMAPDDSRVIPTYCRNVRDGRPLSVWGDGQQVDSFCYVSDAIKVLMAFMDSDHTGMMEIGSPDGITIEALAHMVIRATGIDTPISYESAGGGAVMVCNNASAANIRTPEALKTKNRKVPNISAARNFLRWQPSVSLDEGIKHTFEYYKQLKEQ